MQIAVVHGYLLRGTGSNLYVQNLCREFCRLGHEVYLFSQEGAPGEFDFVARAYEFPAGNHEPEQILERQTPYVGKCVTFRPHLGGLLPVYVYDDYEGYTVKEYPDLTRDELEGYLECNRLALAHVFARRRLDLVLSQHTIMQPVYAARALRDAEMKGVRHYLTVHGSCLNFSVRRSALLQEYAREALAEVDRVICMSEAGRREFVEFFSQDETLEERSRVIPVGVDMDKFVPLELREEKTARIDRLLEGLKSAEESSGTREMTADAGVAEALSAVDWAREPIVLYNGKFLWTKGVQVLLAAAPLILERHPLARFILVGFGSQRGWLEDIVDALDGGDLERLRILFLRPREADPEVDPDSSLYAEGLLEALEGEAFREDYFKAARGHLRGRVIFTGYLGHDLLRYLLPCAEVATAPSIFPEAFGLVAVEALACGVIPLLANHSGFSQVIKEVVEEFAGTFDEERFKPLFLDADLALNLAGNINAFLEYYGEMYAAERRSIRRRARSIAEAKYAWPAIARAWLDLT